MTPQRRFYKLFNPLASLKVLPIIVADSLDSGSPAAPCVAVDNPPATAVHLCYLALHCALSLHKVPHLPRYPVVRADEAEGMRDGLSVTVQDTISIGRNHKAPGLVEQL